MRGGGALSPPLTCYGNKQIKFIVLTIDLFGDIFSYKQMLCPPPYYYLVIKNS